MLPRLPSASAPTARQLVHASRLLLSRSRNPNHDSETPKTRARPATEASVCRPRQHQQRARSAFSSRPPADAPTRTARRPRNARPPPPCTDHDVASFSHRSQYHTCQLGGPHVMTNSTLDRPPTTPSGGATSNTRRGPLHELSLSSLSSSLLSLSLVVWHTCCTFLGTADAAVCGRAALLARNQSFDNRISHSCPPVCTTTANGQPPSSPIQHLAWFPYSNQAGGQARQQSTSTLPAKA